MWNKLPQSAAPDSPQADVWRLATRVVVRLYPVWWRARYGEEFLALLDESGSGPGYLLDVLRGAADARLRGDRGESLDVCQRGALGSALCTAAALAPITALFLRVPEDARLVDAAGRHPLVALSLAVVMLGVVATAVFALSGTVMVCILALREAHRTHTHGLTAALAAVGVGVLLLIVAETVLGVSYASLTQAQRQGETTTVAREVAVGVWAALCVLSLAVSAAGLRRAARRTQFAIEDARTAGALARAITWSAVIVLAGSVVWGAAMLIEAPGALTPLNAAAWLAMETVAALALVPSLIALGRCRRSGHLA
jgi:hypothetical protein